MRRIKTRNNLLRLLFATALIGLSGAVFAQPMIFPVGGDDRSLVYLGNLLGAMGDLPLGGYATSPVIPKMIGIFNEIIFFVAIIVIVYTVCVSVLNTAQEGEMLGKRWSTVWIPARSAMGLFLLLPTNAGYNYIQIFVMWFIIQGVGAANAIWAEVVKSWLTEGSFHTDSRSADLVNGTNTVTQMLASTVCMQLVNANIDAGVIEAPGYVNMWRDGEYLNFGIPPASIFASQAADLYSGVKQAYDDAVLTRNTFQTEADDLQAQIDALSEPTTQNIAGEIVVNDHGKANLERKLQTLIDGDLKRAQDKVALLGQQLDTVIENLPEGFDVDSVDQAQSVASLEALLDSVQTQTSIFNNEISKQNKLIKDNNQTIAELEAERSTFNTGGVSGLRDQLAIKNIDNRITALQSENAEAQAVITQTEAKLKKIPEYETLINNAVDFQRELKGQLSNRSLAQMLNKTQSEIDTINARIEELRTLIPPSLDAIYQYEQDNFQ